MVNPQEVYMELVKIMHCWRKVSLFHPSVSTSMSWMKKQNHVRTVYVLPGKFSQKMIPESPYYPDTPIATAFSQRLIKTNISGKKTSNSVKWHTMNGMIRVKKKSFYGAIVSEIVLAMPLTNMPKYTLLSGKNFSIGNRRKAPFAGGGSGQEAWGSSFWPIAGLPSGRSSSWGRSGRSKTAATRKNACSSGSRRSLPPFCRNDIGGWTWKAAERCYSKTLSIKSGIFYRTAVSWNHEIHEKQESSEIWIVFWAVSAAAL